MTVDLSGESSGELRLADALEAAAPGVVVVLASSPIGAAGSVQDAVFGAGLSGFKRTAGREPARSRPGAVAVELGIDASAAAASGRPEAILLEEAQWADPTSLGLLRRLITHPDRVRLMIIAHRPPDELDRWWLESIAAAATDHGVLIETTGADVAPDGSIEQLDEAGRDLVAAASLAGEPITVAEAATILGVGEAEALRAAETASSAGWLLELRGGFIYSPAAGPLALGESRRGHIAARLASVLEASGGDAGVIGYHHLAAGHPEAAFPRLAAAAIEADQHRAIGEAYHLAETALGAQPGAAVSEPETAGRLHLICGRFLHWAGLSERAADHLVAATRQLQGVERIDALGFETAVAGDRQRPQEAERISAVACWEASRQGEIAKLGSLYTLRAHQVDRIGFATEAEIMLDRADVLLEQAATPVQRYYAADNRGWIALDHGEFAHAEREFARLRDEAMASEPEASQADKEACWGRALLMTGQVGEGLAALERAEELAGGANVEAPVFLAEIARAEASIAMGRYEDALAAANRVLDLVERRLSEWENVARALRAQALHGLGRNEEASSEIAAAIAACPPGADGCRWRSRCNALQLEIQTSLGSPWPAQEAADLADQMLHSKLYHWAIDLMCARAVHEKDDEIAAAALGLAVETGNPMGAARAATAGRLWGKPAAAPAVRSVQRMAALVPAEWRPQWESLPQVEPALSAPPPDDDAVADADHQEALDRILAASGLAGVETVLSPAQRRARGLVGPRRRTLRRWPIVAAAALGVVVVAGAASLAVDSLTDPGPTTTVATTPTTAVPLSLEETLLPEVTERGFFTGTAEHRAGNDRTGAFDAEPVHDAQGHFWVRATQQPIDGAPVAYGGMLLVAGNDGTLYGLDQRTGGVIWRLLAEGPIHTAPAIGTIATADAASPAVVVVGGDDGILRAREALPDRVTERWRALLGERIRSSPAVADGVVYAATTDGTVHALDLGTGEELWRFPRRGTVGPITADLTLHDGVLYVATSDPTGNVILLDVASGEEICRRETDAPIEVNPIVSDEVAYVSNTGSQVYMFPAGVCNGLVAGRPPSLLRERPVIAAPAIRDNVMYIGEGTFLYAIDLATNTGIWDEVVQAGEQVRSVTVAGDVVYAGSDDGNLYAVDADTGETLWTWQTGGPVRAAAAVIDNVVYAVSLDGIVYAIGGD